MSHEAAPPGRLCRDYVLNPITALAFLTLGEKQYLLAAEDTDIRVYDVATSRLCGTLSVFCAQSIHGIAVPPAAEDDGSSRARRDPPLILVWGGHVVKILPGRVIEELIDANSKNGDDSTDGLAGKALASPEAIAPDWIFDGRISPFGDDHIVLLTAHNEVIQGYVSADHKTLVLGRVQSPSRPILYSGNFFWVKRDCMLVAAGTVFGEIVVWKCHLDSNVDTDGRDGGPGQDDLREMKEIHGCEVLFVFSGHEGSIFGVHISPEIQTSSGEVVRLLASCSDDRTIRIWDITERCDEATKDNTGYQTQISDARQTGFGDSIVGSMKLVNSSSRCVTMAMGHVSRIWQVEIQTPGPLSIVDAIEVYSFGEDATIQRWHLELDGPGTTPRTLKTEFSNNSRRPEAKLTHHETFSNHNGKQIWSHAMISGTEGLIIATGGGDGKIALMKHGSVHATTPDDATDDSGPYPRSIQELDVSPAYLIERCQHPSASTASSISSFKHGNGKEMFQSFAFIAENRLFITTRSGRLFLGSFGSTTKWTELSIPDAIRTTIQSYTILRSSRKASLAFIGATNGELFLYHEASGESLRSVHQAQRKITEIICLSDTCSPSLQTDRDHEGGQDGCTEILVTVFGSTKAEVLRLDKNLVLVRRTEVTVPDEFIVTAAAWCHNYLILGSRNGSISIFDRALNRESLPILTIEVTVGDKITSILPLPRRSENSPLYFLTTARDGKYRIYEILSETSNPQVRLLHETKPPFGPLIEGSWLFTKRDGKQDLMLCGFRSKHFVIWNVTQQNEVATIDCGGGHRVFDHVQMKGKSEGFRFACTKASQMKISSQTHAPHMPLKTGGHGREIKAVSASGLYVATGAEDTMIRIWELHKNDRKRDRKQPSLCCVLALEKHNTGIQKLKWYKDQYLFSSGGNEEFFVWRVMALESDVCPLGIVCEAVFPDRSEVGDSRITDFDVQCLNENADLGSEKSQMEPEFCISMTLSNSTVQSYLYSAQHGFRLLGRRLYTGACLTQLRHLSFVDRCYPQILAAATDGHLVVIADVRSETEEGILVTKLHQSTVKSLDIRSIATEMGTSYLVVTGGDDNAIGVLHLYIRSSGPSPFSKQPTTTNSSSVPASDLTLIENSSQSLHIQGRGQYEIRNKSIVRSAHAAAVTGLGIVRLENNNQDAVVVTTSNDQRVKTWRLVGWRNSSSPSPLRVHLLDDRYSGVADAGDLEVVRDGESILVAGVGVEVWGVN
ncbi:WD40 repeat-like protein [Xylariaceae sp. AK1471]|nr:WD40 repeat-like protein [Xylariaceae sp. AK1471]